MGVLDKFLNIMKLDDDYDEEEDFLGEEEEFEEYEPKPKKSLFKKEKEEYEDFDLQEDHRGKSTSVAGNSNNLFCSTISSFCILLSLKSCPN